MSVISVRLGAAAVALLTAAAATGQTTNDPFRDPIPATDGVITIGVEEFASLPFVDGEAARMMRLVDEPATGRLFVNDMRGLVYTVSYDGGTVTRYLDLTDPRWGLAVEASRRERGFQSFALHPQFGVSGAPGYGRLYTYTDTSNTAPPADFVPNGGSDAQDTILLEWTATDPAAAVYDGGPPRELLRMEQPFRNHNGGQLGFNPLAAPGDPDFGLLYVGSADGGSGGDPLDVAQDLGSILGKILRIDPLGTNSTNGQYGIPADNPFASDGDPATLAEIYAYGVRNPQRFAWDERNGNLFMADIGQNIVEEVSLVPRGGNLGWNDWEGSFRFISRQEVSLVDPRGEAGLSYPVVEYGQLDPLFQRSSMATGLVVYRDDALPQLANLVLFGDGPSGEVFYFSADHLPEGGQDAMRRVLLRHGSGTKTLLQVIQEKNVNQGRDPAARADVRIDPGPDGQVFLLNKHDGVIRRLVP
ncbi:MAG: PQQ-dependent sugar dehydrogenase [Acidobacteria bacterium]|nr:PQQ-dependent sugar dehydrogenase [Acidobacteriota bacterium]